MLDVCQVFDGLLACLGLMSTQTMEAVAEEEGERIPGWDPNG